MKNDAFISYSHRTDLVLATAVEKALERLARPLLATRAMEVFRDRSDLAANPGLQPALERELAASRWLILFASPAAATSSYCRKELQWWLAQRGTAQLLIALTDGDIVWDEGASDFDWQRSTALPSDLRGAFASEPLFVDLRPQRQVQQLTLAHAPFREAILDLAAPIHGVPKNQLDHDDVKRQRRVRRLLQAGAVAISSLAVLATSAALVARQQAQHALARQLSAQAMQVVQAQPDLGLLLAVQALAEADTVGGRGALLDALLDQPHLMRVRRDASIADFEREGFIFGRRLDPRTPQPTDSAGRRLPCEGNAESAAAVGDASITAYGCQGGGISMVTPRGWRTLEGRLSHDQPVTALVFSADERTLISGGFDGRILLWHVGSAQAMEPALADRLSAVTALGRSADGRSLVSLHQDGSARVWRFDVRPRARQPLAGVDDPQILFDDLGAQALRQMAIDWQTGHAQRLAQPRPQSTATANVEPDTTKRLDDSLQPALVDPSRGWRVLGGDDGFLRPQSFDGSRPLHTPIEAHRGRVAALAASQDGTRLASGGADAQVMLWDTATWQRLASLPANGFAHLDGPMGGREGEVRSVAWNADASMLAATAMNGFALWLRGAPPWTRRGFVAPGVERVAFAADGQALYTDGASGPLAWSLDVAQWKRIACEVAGRNLTRAEWDEYVSFDDGSGTAWLSAFNPGYRATCPQWPLVTP